MKKVKPLDCSLVWIPKHYGSLLSLCSSSMGSFSLFTFEDNTSLCMQQREKLNEQTQGSRIHLTWL